MIISKIGRLQTPLPQVPAKRFVPLIARALTSVFVKPIAVQLVPLLVERKTPPSDPAKRFVPLTARAETFVFVKPLLTAVQLVPLLVERKTPPPLVPAKRFLPLTARAKTQLCVPCSERWDYNHVIVL